jgi:hypothetical protein
MIPDGLPIWVSLQHIPCGPQHGYLVLALDRPRIWVAVLGHFVGDERFVWVRVE